MCYISDSKYILSWHTHGCFSVSHGSSCLARHIILITEPSLSALTHFSCVVPPITLNFIWHLTQSSLLRTWVANAFPPPPTKKWIGNNNNDLHSLLWLSAGASALVHGTDFNGEDWYWWLGTFLGMLVTVLGGDMELLLKGPGHTIKPDSQRQSPGGFTALISTWT